MKTASTSTLAIAFVLAISLFLVGYEVYDEEFPDKNQQSEAIGFWRGASVWEQNRIELRLRPDSMMTFKAYKEMCPGTAIICALGSWRMKNDSVIEMYEMPNSKLVPFFTTFPEMKDSPELPYVMSVVVTGTYIIKDGKIWNMNKDGSRNLTQFFDRVEEPTKAK
jgi:hypothetical protein